jgi:FixJ family two-component response regulator
VQEQERPIIYIVDGDSSVRLAMKRLLLSSRMNAMTFATPQEFLGSRFQDHNACLIADVNGTGDSGLELQKALVSMGARLPVIFMTTFEVDEARDRLKEEGAVGYFRKPVDGQALMDAILWALSAPRTHLPQ